MNFDLDSQMWLGVLKLQIKGDSNDSENGFQKWQGVLWAKYQATVFKMKQNRQCAQKQFGVALWGASCQKVTGQLQEIEKYFVDDLACDAVDVLLEVHPY